MFSTSRIRRVLVVYTLVIFTWQGAVAFLQAERGISSAFADCLVVKSVAGLLSDHRARLVVVVDATLIAAFGLWFLLIASTSPESVAGIVPVIVTSLSDLYSGSKEVTAQGLRFSASGLTQTAFPVIAGAVVIVVGWRYLILLHGMAIPIAIAVQYWFKIHALRVPVATSVEAPS